MMSAAPKLSSMTTSPQEAMALRNARFAPLTGRPITDEGRAVVGAPQRVNHSTGDADLCPETYERPVHESNRSVRC